MTTWARRPTCHARPQRGALVLVVATTPFSTTTVTTTVTTT
jgi:hypothetical protein